MSGGRKIYNNQPFRKPFGTVGGVSKYRLEVEIRTVAGKTNLQEVMAYFRLTREIRLRLMMIDDSVNRIVRSVYKEPDEEAVLLRQA